jgi:hypothetical protein
MPFPQPRNLPGPDETPGHTLGRQQVGEVGQNPDTAAGHLSGSGRNGARFT